MYRYGAEEPGRARLHRHGLRRHQARIIRLLVERADVSPTGTDIRLRLDGRGSLVSELNPSTIDRRQAA